MIPYGRQTISEADIQAVVDVLHSDYLTQGPAVPAFEIAVASYCGAQHAVAVNSATSALHIACLALDVGPGDIVWTSPITFVASANCALYCGAQVDFVDIDAKTYNLSVERLAQKLEIADKTGKLPKVVIPVHLAGLSCDMEAIHALGKQYGFRIIEDASHAIGGRYKDEPIGGCKYSDVTVFSFHPVKIITTGEGGIAVTNNPELADRMQLLRSHGITRDANKMTHVSDGPWYYQQIGLGFNYRMTDIQAALGLSQLRQLDEFVARRNKLARSYDLFFAGMPVLVPWQHPDIYSAFHLYVIRLQLGKLNKNHREIFELLRASDIGVNLHYIPVYRQPYYEKLGYDRNDYPEAEKYYTEAISIPMFSGLTDQMQLEVKEKIELNLR
ncbi:UDP-4-amino-4,6-dideoxy-N-acetyl-beta-L-altrosamine transaminase [Methylovorus sp. MM2]|uniref:UDP-4-amino-4, 6-dideoxy-N-acetyl-beta-L-altrosamine transaminase n=1 Tax=Methylovorus sp. MM2 TaxID=1848038 RepID=UPI0007E1689C|nr:UDP-4-amino-4,6-dideoxy-N-acetyl-beta-L-altrosamine transaminase [Methylovorus sp. MM2]OAM53148.1 UDP-4-amino-4,6-dideoxy-N-acetyl-beta-L-altrosamine transaminase [Methylovorus sp. MM2]